MSVIPQDRLRAVVGAGIAIASELSVDALLQRTVEIAAELTESSYAALGVLDAAGTHLERFVTTGIPVEQHRAIGDLPTGRGILGALIRDARPLRLDDLSQDPRSVGFPPGHPPMKSFLGVPILVRGAAWGNLYLTEKRDGAPYGADDEDIAVLLAAQAGAAIENARLYEASTRWSRQLETLHETVRSMVGETDVDRLLALVCARVRELTEARIALIALPDGDLLRVAAADSAGDEAAELRGMRFPRASKAGRVLERRQSARVDSVLEDPEIDQEAARRLGVRTAMFVPLVAAGRSIGVIALHDHRGRDGRFSDPDLRVAEIFAARAAVAVELSERVARDTVRRVVEAQEVERARLARELHDETGQALTSILLGLKAIRGAPSPEAAEEAETAVRDLVVQALQDVRSLAVELRPAALDDFGLVAALERLVDTFSVRAELPATLQADVGDRLAPELEIVLYRLVQESLTNVAKHAGASHVAIAVRRTPSAVVAEIADDGTGFDPEHVRDDALGLAGMRERVALVGGTLAVETQRGRGTRLVARIPLTDPAEGL
jgi:signal transduction histidine kinase